MRVLELTVVSAPGYRGAVRVLPEGETAQCETSQAGEETETGLDLSRVETLREGESYRGEHSNFRLLEIGCGTGSTVFPILEMNTRPDLMIYCCDLSQVRHDLSLLIFSTDAMTDCRPAGAGPPSVQPGPVLQLGL